MGRLTACGLELSHALRSLAKARAFALVCVGSLGLGTGTVMVILMMVRAIGGTPPLVNADGLVELLDRRQGSAQADSDSWTYPAFVDLAAADTGMALTAWTFAETVLRTRNSDEPLRLSAMYVSSNYFATIGVALARGPGFSSGGAGPPVVVVDHDLWQNYLGGRPDLIGTTITLNRVAHVVVGITPPRFRGHISPEDSPDVRLWLPLDQHPRLGPSGDLTANQEEAWLKVHGRLSPGTTLARARSNAAAAVEPYHPMGARSRREMRATQAILFGLSGMVLLIVCVNVSGMMLVRTAVRERELSVRLALGASRSRLFLHILAEALVLALVGGAVAAFIVFGIPSVLVWYFEFGHRDLDLFRPDVWTYLTCAGLCLVTTLVFGLMPAVRFSRPALVSALKDDVGGGRRRVGRVHKWTAAIQAGLAVPFLAFGGVKLDQVSTVGAADVGFEPVGLFASRVDLSDGGRNDVSSTGRFLLDQLRTNLGAAAGVTHVTVSNGMPLDFRRRETRVVSEGNPVATRAHTTRIDEHFFDTLGIRVIRGRGIVAEDLAGATPVVVISEPLAARLFPGQDAVGKRITFEMESLPVAGAGPNRQRFGAGDPMGQAYAVVGVTADAVTSQMGTPRPQLFVSLAQHPVAGVQLIARSTAADDAMMAAFNTVVSQVDPDFARTSLTTGAGIIRRSVTDLATQSALAIGCASVALILTALGVFGVVGFMVATRTREIGVRMALGASRLRVLRTVQMDAVKVVVPGIGVGLIGAVALVRFGNLPETWYDLGAVELLVYAAAAGVACAVALLAGLPPAHRASRINPIQAMRTE